jgi:hypothetical protein
MIPAAISITETADMIVHVAFSLSIVRSLGVSGLWGS